MQKFCYSLVCTYFVFYSGIPLYFYNTLKSLPKLTFLANTTTTPSGHHIIWCSSKKVSRKWLRKKKNCIFWQEMYSVRRTSGAVYTNLNQAYTCKIKLRSLVFLKGRDFFSRQILTQFRYGIRDFWHGKLDIKLFKWQICKKSCIEVCMYLSNSRYMFYFNNKKIMSHVYYDVLLFDCREW